MNRRFALFMVLAILCSATAFGADLTVASQVNLAEADYANNFFTFKGSVTAAEKDQFVADATSGASRLGSTALFNAYRLDVKGKKTLPAGLRGLFLYGVADFGTLTGDALSVIRTSDGVITIEMVHRGTAYLMVTDSGGKIYLPNGTFRMRKIGHTDNKISPDFSSSGKVSGINWAKVWDASTPDGNVIEGTPSKTGPIVADAVDSGMFAFSGSLQVSLDGSLLKVAGSLDAVKR